MQLELLFEPEAQTGRCRGVPPHPWQGTNLPWPISRFWARYRPRIHRWFPENVRRGCDVSRMHKRWQY